MDLMAYVPHFSEAPDVERKPVIKHACEQPFEMDEVEIIEPGTHIWADVLRWCLRQRIVSRKHPLARWCLKSTTAVNYEISKHLKSYSFMIHPFSSFRIFWESMMTVFTFVALLITPVTITFYYEEHEHWHMANDLMNCVFLCDIIVWFFTGYYDYRTKVVVLDPIIVARKYLKSFFFIDILTVLPIQIVDFIVPESMWYCTTLNMMKILRLRNIIVYGRRLHYVYRISFQTHKILETAVVIVTCIHWSACLEYYVPMSVKMLGTLQNDSWIYHPHLSAAQTNSKKYLICLNRAIVAFVRSAHHLCMKASEDILLNLLITIIGYLCTLYLLTQFSQLLTTFQITIKRNLKTIQQLQEYMRYKELPWSLQRRLLTYYYYRNKRGFERNKKIIEEVSPYLREELILHNYFTLINSVELFKHLPDSVIVQLISAIKSEIFMAGDEVVNAGSRGDALYFICSGTVAVYTAMGREICHLEDGSYFGEIALVMDSEHRIATIVAVETSEIYMLHRENFRRAISPYPDLLNRLQNVALDHLRRSLLLDSAQELPTHHTPQYINISSIQSKRII